ncbi:hypothetical protein GOP47_0019927 [Adiantum capillus-veneris]|uniref:Uncharacterized protein n=1 Tax=Adiantum capillus-veneris TaxID=13818 RepID=A0A9D4UCQ0_ADICA|nr:hypothetical protein GOP47_0019927 [Adiantum capillus-veneris]
MDEEDENRMVRLSETQPDDSFAMIEDAPIDRIEDALAAILKELVGDQTTNTRALRSELIEAIRNSRDTIEDYAITVADIQVTKLEEQILSLEKELMALKAQVKRLNAILCRFSSILNRS